LVNTKFDSEFDNAIKNVYYLFRNWTEEKNGNFYKYAFSVSDEVSFILNTGDNYFKNRPLKICTVMSGSLSSSITNQKWVNNRTKKKLKK